MKVNILNKSILALLGCFLFVQSSIAQNWEVDLLKSINPQNPNSTAWRGVTNSAYPLSVGLPIGVFIVGAVTKNKVTELDAAEMAASFLATSAAAKIIKVAVNRQRPYQRYTDIYPYKFEDGQSIPSGHASLAFSTATTVSLIYKRWYVVVPAYAWATSVAYSRLYLGEHYPTDVLAGAVVGAGSAWLSHQVRKWVFKPKKPAKTAP